jgi:thiol-disulfide isomerase/thioredoxin
MRAANGKARSSSSTLTMLPTRLPARANWQRSSVQTALFPPELLTALGERLREHDEAWRWTALGQSLGRSLEDAGLEPAVRRFAAPAGLAAARAAPPAPRASKARLGYKGAMRWPRPLLWVFAALVLAGGCRKAPGADWNDAQIPWQKFDEGLATAKREGKPILLVFTTEWCPHCKTYRGVFKDPGVVAKSARFVMVRVDSDKDPALSRRYAPDGEYIPRTLFLSSSGILAAKIHAPRNQARFFYDENDPADLLAGMDAALRALP